MESRNRQRCSSIPGPSAKRIAEALTIDLVLARRIKGMMLGDLNSKRIVEEENIPDRKYMDRPRRILSIANKYSDRFGVECILRKDDVFCLNVVEYVNMGETYQDTLLYDYKTNRFYVTSWEDFVETRESQFE
jgi:hypothetical protein